MPQTSNLGLYYDFPGSLPHKSFVEQLSSNMQTVDLAFASLQAEISSAAKAITLDTVIPSNAAWSTQNSVLDIYKVGDIAPTANPQYYGSYIYLAADSIALNQLVRSIASDETKWGQLYPLSRSQYMATLAAAVGGIRLIGLRKQSGTTVPVYSLEIDGVSRYSVQYYNNSYVALGYNSTNAELVYLSFYNKDTNDYIQQSYYKFSIANTSVYSISKVLSEIQEARTSNLSSPDALILREKPAPPYSILIPVSGILSTDNPIVDILTSDDYATAQLEQDAWAQIYKITTTANQIAVYTKSIPSVPLSIQLKVVR